MRIEFSTSRCTLIVAILLAISIPSVSPTFVDVLSWAFTSVFNARNAVSGLSYVASFVRTAVKIFTLLDPTSGVITVLRGRREVKGIDFSHLETTFTSATLNDRMECLPMVFCAIYADPVDLVSPVESKFKKAFSSFFSEGYTPVWAAKYVKATLVGETSKSDARCQAEYPKCTYSPRNLRRLITQTVKAYFYKMNHKVVKS